MMKPTINKLLSGIMVLSLYGCTTSNTINYTLETEATIDDAALQEKRSQYTTTSAFAGEAWYDQHQVFSINELDVHASMEYYDTLSDAIMASESVLDDIDQSISSSVYDLNGQWSFYYVEKPEYRLRGYTGSDISTYSEAWDTTDWDQVTIPHSIQCERNADGSFKYESPHYVNTTYPWLETETIQYGGDGLPVAATSFNGVSHYKRDFTIDHYDPNHHYILHFDGVSSAFYVYINGQCIGYSEDSYSPSDFDITTYIVEGTNTIALEVYRYSDGSYLENQDMIRLNGVFRDVSIVEMGSNSVYDIETTVSYGDTIDLTIDLTTIDANQDQHTLTAYLVDQDGTIIHESTMEYTSTQGFNEHTMSMDDLTIHRWNIDDPYLYRLITVVDDQPFYNVIRIGFRELSWDDASIYINGHAILLNGINRHEMDPYTGKALSDETIINDLILIKSLNINAIRLSHYPNDPLTYDVADELGLLLIDEANIESHGGAIELSLPGNDPSYIPEMLYRIDNMIERDINHASIIIWSYGNESTYATYPLDDNYGFYEIAKHVLEKDPSRLRMYERDNRVGQTRETSMVDIASSQYLSIDEMIDMANDYDIPYLQQEYAHAMGNGLGNFKEYHDAILANDIAGGFVWDFADQSIYTCENGQCYFGNGNDWGQILTDGNFCGNGIVSADRTLQSEAYELKAVYSPIQINIETDKVVLTNHYPTRSLTGLTMDIVVVNDQTSTIVYSTPLDLSAQETMEYPITITSDPQVTTEVLQVYIYETDQTRDEWIAFNQTQLKRDPIDLSLTNSGEATIGQTDTTYTLTSSDGNKQVSFDKTTGTLKEYTVDGNTILSTGGTIQLLRAKIDNDPLVNIDLYDKPYDGDVRSSIQVDDGLTSIIVEYDYTTLDVTMESRYTFNGELDMVVETTIHTGSLSNTGPLLLVGTAWQIDPSYDTYTYTGYGQYDSYNDRSLSAIYGTYTQTIGQYQPMYLTPQTSEHKLDVDQLSISNGQTTLSFTMAQPLGFTYQTNDPSTIQNASHWYHLQADTTNTLIIDRMMRGIGNGSNGPQTLDQYCIQENTDYSLAFRFMVQP